MLAWRRRGRRQPPPWRNMMMSASRAIFTPDGAGVTDPRMCTGTAVTLHIVERAGSGAYPESCPIGAHAPYAVAMIVPGCLRVSWRVRQPRQQAHARTTRISLDPTAARQPWTRWTWTTWMSTYWSTSSSTPRSRSRRGTWPCSLRCCKTTQLDLGHVQRAKRP
jgi:hypothetical protein